MHNKVLISDTTSDKLLKYMHLVKHVFMIEAFKHNLFYFNMF